MTMTFEQGLAWGLLFLNLVQLIFWSIQNQRLVNKLMSRNYAEYEQAQKPLEPRVVVKEFEEAAEEQDILRELNGMIGH